MRTWRIPVLLVGGWAVVGILAYRVWEMGHDSWSLSLANKAYLLSGAALCLAMAGVTVALAQRRPEVIGLTIRVTLLIAFVSVALLTFWVLFLELTSSGPSTNYWPIFVIGLIVLIILGAANKLFRRYRSLAQ